MLVSGLRANDFLALRCRAVIMLARSVCVTGTNTADVLSLSAECCGALIFSKSSLTTATGLLGFCILSFVRNIFISLANASWR